ncbi:uncharacterized protein TNCV_2688961 [Trichonephila clavipes]|nr:uncharacterized protein TNCV_2688961 [Trichonephila clavipes]
MFTDLYLFSTANLCRPVYKSRTRLDSSLKEKLTMEKFGYLVCDSCSPGEFLYINPSLFLNIIDCVQNVVLCKDISDKRIVYFKILNNSEIVQYIHNDAQEEYFGFCQLHRTDPNDKFKVFSPNKNLFVNLLDCVLEARDITSQIKVIVHVSAAIWLL